ncbi:MULTISPECIES: Cas10/Cmr2 second palm domain-containing protein [Pseudanabaena]|uniref:Cas10/Cmr2 second palm domain-containing protein n=2 Tax=Pseudanabaena TaxID=1152 RepID=L8MXZ2_9CYAN|nr:MULTISPECIES: hypothetical protein [Pseudanabaena]ELS31689.1 hypothetical protein Pse7429DRAFT_3283 [Pseudanabaena biceps PCC 7429]MDG3496050.1 hypothetical protein [Pseudanabaena catenata USMAC16]
MHLVLLETSGNQSYIFSTNKLKENIGASELTYRAGTKCVLDAVAEIRKQASLWSADSKELRWNLLDPKQNPRLDGNTNSKVEVIIATSGKALLLVSEKEIGKTIIRWATYAALRDSPGIDLCGVISDDFELGESGQLAEAIRQVHQQFEEVKAKRPSMDMRFLRLPIVDECATSGLPAAELSKDSAEDTEESTLSPYSAVSMAKRKNHIYGEQRIAAMLRRYDPALKLSESLTFADETQWLAIIHADGNGLGEIFLSFDKHLLDLIQQKNKNANSLSDREYAERVREFSIALDICTEKAFVTALKATFLSKEKTTSLPIAPLVLGGDDLTVVCNAQYALQFTVYFLKEFEKETTLNQIIGDKTITIVPELAKIALGVPRLSACAGIAIVKPHFPFSVAYHLAEQLLKTAKTVKSKVTQLKGTETKPYPCSAIDFHILYDSSGTDLDTIREKQQVDNGQTLLYNSPYVVTNIDDIPENNGKAWATRHDWNALRSKAKALNPDQEVDHELPSKLPNSQVHTLRSHLYMGREAANGYYQMIKGRYDFANLEDSEGSLFHKEQDSDVHTTSLLDAMDVTAFLDFDIKAEQRP